MRRPLLLALLLLLLVLACAQLSSAQEGGQAAEDASVSEESAGREVAELPNADGGKVTLIDNHNHYLHVDPVQKEASHFVVEEEKRKAEAKNTKEAERLLLGAEKEEDKEKRARLKAMQDMRRDERKEKDKLREQFNKKAKELDAQTKEKLAKASAEHSQKVRLASLAAAKRFREEQGKEETAKQGHKSREQKEKDKAREEAKKREEYAKKWGLSVGEGWEVFHTADDRFGEPLAYRYGALCVVSGMVRAKAEGPEFEHKILGWLPQNCRPAGGRIVFALPQPARASVRVDMLPDGRVAKIGDGAPKDETTWVSLSGLTFAISGGVSLPLLWNWKPNGHDYRAPTQTVVGGLCVVSGVIRDGRWGYFAQATRACRPQDGRLTFSGDNEAAVARIDVLKVSGQVMRAGGSANHGWVSLDGIIYAPRGGKALPLAAGWSNRGEGYRAASYLRAGPLCVLSGSVATRTWPAALATLPAGCRPKTTLVFAANAHDHNADVRVHPDGRVEFVAGRSRYNWLSLSSIHFVAHN